jgi:hypothetical protein
MANAFANPSVLVNWLSTLDMVESMTTGQPVVRRLVALPVPLDVSLVGGGGREP